MRPNAAEIHRKVHEAFPKDAPVEKTVQNIVSSRRPDETGAWEPTVAAPDIDAALVLPLLAHVIEVTEGKRRHLTLAEARLLTAVRTAAPTIAPAAALALAREYISATTPTYDLDAFLAFAPWDNVESRRLYEVALTDGWVRPPVLWRRQQQMERAVADVNTMRAAVRAKVQGKTTKTERPRRSARKGSGT